MRTASCTDNVGRLLAAVDRLTALAPMVDELADTTPTRVPPLLVGGVRRPVEDIALAREDLGVTPGIATTRAAIIQATLHAETAVRSANGALDTLDATPNRP
ncbi:putative membrane protein [Actinokineospora baliensis]|uniref:hypothetical protein n=1 Tax=Actinokineospora baliensis TaxID=547056 RepID=UPI00195E5578|nr:hypothetical protein [Actinokineospora baliensis]MBM7770606.1 putative membrane protein [Actinokineospora baliensis]